MITSYTNKHLLILPNWLWLIIIMFLMILLLSWNVIFRSLDSTGLYTDRGIYGPYATANTVVNQTTVSNILARLTPGQTFFYISDFCPASNVSYTKITTLVKVGEENRVLLSSRVDYAQNERRCGSSVYSMTLPNNLEPGIYQINRFVIFYVDGSAPRRAQLHSMLFEVVPNEQ